MITSLARSVSSKAPTKRLDILSCRSKSRHYHGLVPCMFFMDNQDREIHLPHSHTVSRINFASFSSGRYNYCTHVDDHNDARTLSTIAQDQKIFSVMGCPSHINNMGLSQANVDSNARPPPFSKILVANRGEIAVRVIQSAKSLGMKTVAIHSTADYRSPHVSVADEAVCVGSASSLDSYLNIDNIIKAIKDTGAEAVHPGYGFLSENSEFARRIKEETNAKFVGPNSDAIIAMGDKITSKKIASSAGVNIIPGFEGTIETENQAVSVAKDIGFPVMIKATSGGGGKGMRICYTEAELREGFQLSRAEAKSFFDDDRVFVEKFVERPHHIEFQVLSGINPDSGELDILVFPERECSIQRRNQKIVEESPSTLLDPETRREMARQVRSLVRNVHYESAGTVEFLVDEEQNFYFLEMNTRLQVEHPVTEMISTGAVIEKGIEIDLVKGMFEVAAGHGIPKEYLEVFNNYDDGHNDKEGKVMPFKGHAIEARIYAENPLRGFLPSNGPLLQYIEPPPHIRAQTHLNTDNSEAVFDTRDRICCIRVDSGVTAGSNITTFYDPILSKLVAYSPNSRNDSIIALREALDRYVLRGVGHNLAFISDVLRHENFIAGDTPTDFISNHYPDGFSGVQLDDLECAEFAAIVANVGALRRTMLLHPSLPFSKNGDGNTVIVCFGGMFGDAFSVTSIDKEGKKYEVTKLEHRHSFADINLNDNKFIKKVEIQDINFNPSNTIVDVTVNGQTKALQIECEDNTGLFHAKMHGTESDIMIMSPHEYNLSLFMNEPVMEDTSDKIKSPMPGTLISYDVTSGDRVEEGQEICIVEAMKMQNVIRSPRSGVIEQCVAEVGSSLKVDEVIVQFQSNN